MRKIAIRSILLIVILFLFSTLEALCQNPADEGKKRIIYLTPPPEDSPTTLTEKEQRNTLGLLQELEIRRRESSIFQRYIEQEEKMNQEREQLKAESIKLAQDKQKFAEDQLAKSKDETNTYKLLYESLLNQKKRSKGCTFYKAITLWLGQC